MNKYNFSYSCVQNEIRSENIKSKLPCPHTYLSKNKGNNSALEARTESIKDLVRFLKEMRTRFSDL